MNKKQIDEFIPKAYEALQTFGVATLNKDNIWEIPKTFRGYISSFGAAVVMGSLRAAIAFNSSQNGAEHARENLMKIIYSLISNDKPENVNNTSLLSYVIENKDNEAALKEQIYNAAIATKLAMNMYLLVDKNNKEKKSEENDDGVQ